MSALHIATAGPVDGLFVRRLLAMHAIPGAEVADPASRSHTRLIPTSAGAVCVTVVLGTGVTARIAAENPAVLAETLAAVRRWLDLDTDIRPATARLAATPSSGRSCAPGRASGWSDSRTSSRAW